MSKNLNDMSKEKIYVNPKLQTQTVALLKEFKTKHPNSKTPMADAYAETPNVSQADTVRFMRAARALGWKVVRYRGGYYENGVHIWQQFRTDGSCVEAVAK